MGVKQAVAFVAVIATSPAVCADEILHPQLAPPTTMLYVSFPLGATTAKQRAPAYGFALQGRRQYETIRLDTRTLAAFEAALGGIEAKWLLAAGVVAAAGYYAVKKDEDRSDNYSGSQNRQQNNPPPPPPACEPDPCKK